jgi:phosphonate transport system permease protein
VSILAPASRRPAKPRRSPLVSLGAIAFLGITLLSVSPQFGIGLDPGALVANLGRGAEIIRELLNPNWAFLPRTIEPLIETFQMAVVSAFVGCGLALPIAFFASRVTAPGRASLGLTRAILSVVRAIPDFLYALIFVAAVGIGPLPGIVALVLFDIGVVVKLLSETVDAVDTGPIEAARAGGSSRTQTVRWSVLPQVLPNYVAFALYAFELNVRASTVIGVVGAGGIGTLLFTQYRFFEWSNVSVIVIELFVIVLAIELISIRLRRRLV